MNCLNLRCRTMRGTGGSCVPPSRPHPALPAWPVAGAQTPRGHDDL